MQAAIVSFLAGVLCTSAIAFAMARRALRRLRDEFDEEIRESEDALARAAVIARRPALLADVRTFARKASAGTPDLAPLFRTLCDGLGGRRAWLLSPCGGETASIWEFDARGRRGVAHRALPSECVEPLARIALESDGTIHIPSAPDLSAAADPLRATRRRLRDAGSTDAIAVAVCPPASSPWVLGIEYGSRAEGWGAEEMEILQEAAAIIAAEIDRSALREAVDVLRRRLLASGPPARAASADLNAIAATVAEALHRNRGPRVRVDLRLRPALPPLSADPVDVEHLLVNACLNARAGTSVDGTIRVETGLVEEGDVGANRRFVELRVSDDGSGANDRPAAPGGSLLGFWTPDVIASRLGGQADWTRGPGDATTLRVRFPVEESLRARQVA